MKIKSKYSAKKVKLMQRNKMFGWVWVPYECCWDSGTLIKSIANEKYVKISNENSIQLNWFGAM